MKPAGRTRGSNITGPRRGVTVIVAVMMMLLIAGAIAGLTLLFAGDARRTKAAVEGAQVRQLLLAGEPAAADELLRHGAGAREVAVATPVGGANLTLKIAPSGRDGAQVRVVAGSPGLKGSQLLTFDHRGNNWQLESAVLIGQP
jgi:hypothetical protein